MELFAAVTWKPFFPLIEEPITKVYSILAIVLLCGLTIGYLTKLLKLPSISGNILAGLLLGPVLGIVDTLSETSSTQLEPINELAFSLIAISIGSHLKFRVLHNAIQRIVTIVLAQIIVLPLTVFGATFLVLNSWGDTPDNTMFIALFMGVLSLATAPATVVHVVKEARAKGVFVKTLIAVVVLNNVANIALFEIVKEYFYGPVYVGRVVWVAASLLAAALLGTIIGLCLVLVRRNILSRQRTATFSFAALMIAYGLSVELGLSPVIANLSLGIFLANFSDRNQILDVFEDFEEILYAVFFTLTGTHAHFSNLGTVGALTGIYLAGRLIGNLFTVLAARYITPVPKRVNKYLALSLAPQAGITIGLLVALESVEGAGNVVSVVTPVLLLAIIISEIIGPLVIRFSLKRCGEEGQAMPRLIDFLEEEYISLNLKARDKKGVMIEMVEFLFKTHSLENLDKTAFLQSVLLREKQTTTGMGKGIAIPHGIIEDGDKIMGVMGIFREGLEWNSIDGKKVYMVILIATPPENEKNHLGVMAAISKLFSRRTVVGRGLHLARTPAQVYEEIADEEFSSLNRVLDEN